MSSTPLDLLNGVINYDKQIEDYLNQHVSIMLKASILNQVLHDATQICRKLPEAAAMAEDTFIDDRTISVGKIC